MINNAGINMNSEVELTPVSVYEKGFNVNLYGALRVTRQFLPLIRQSKGNYKSTPGVFEQLQLDLVRNPIILVYHWRPVLACCHLDMCIAVLV